MRAHLRLGWLLAALLGTAAPACVGPGLEPPGERGHSPKPGANGAETRQDAGSPTLPPSQPGRADGGADMAPDPQTPGEPGDGEMDAGGP